MKEVSLIAIYSADLSGGYVRVEIHKKPSSCTLSIVHFMRINSSQEEEKSVWANVKLHFQLPVLLQDSWWREEGTCISLLSLFFLPTHSLVVLQGQALEWRRICKRGQVSLAWRLCDRCPTSASLIPGYVEDEKFSSILNSMDSALLIRLARDRVTGEKETIYADITRQAAPIHPGETR